MGRGREPRVPEDVAVVVRRRAVDVTVHLPREPLIVPPFDLDADVVPVVMLQEPVAAVVTAAAEGEGVVPAAVATTVPREPLAVLHGVPFVHAQLDRLDGRGRQADVRRPRVVFRDAVVRDDELVALQRISPPSDPAPAELLVRVGVRRVVAIVLDPRARIPRAAVQDDEARVRIGRQRGALEGPPDVAAGVPQAPEYPLAGYRVDLEVDVVVRPLHAVRGVVALLARVDVHERHHPPARVGIRV